MKKQNKTTKPLVSVIMPVYNGEKYLSEAIKSILNQTYRHFELIIINDASTDGSSRIIAAYKRYNRSKIKVMTLPATLNRGGDACANEGLKLAVGKYIARLDADDIAREDRLEKQVAYLEKNPHIFAVGSNAVVIDKLGRKIGVKNEPGENARIKAAFFTFNPLIHPSMMIRRTYASTLPFHYLLKHSANNDYYTFFRLSCQGARFANLSEPLIEHRIHGQNDTFINIKKKFSNTLKTRLEMVFRYGFRPSLAQIFICFLQIVLVYGLPETVLKNIYFYSKGIKSLSSDLKKILSLPKLRLRYN